MWRDCVKPHHWCHSEEPQATRNLALPLRALRARFLAEFTLSERQGFFAGLRMTSEGLGMTACCYFEKPWGGAYVPDDLCRDVCAGPG